MLLISSAQRNDLKPSSYLKDVLTRLADLCDAGSHLNRDELRLLLPNSRPVSEARHRLPGPVDVKLPSLATSIRHGSRGLPRVFRTAARWTGRTLIPNCQVSARPSPGNRCTEAGHFALS
ncbi:MAG: transposase domain-containing protein [Planctomycetes bacterium]|nr:transposase domain-containing protein [Planctomycetota bacterium]